MNALYRAHLYKATFSGVFGKDGQHIVEHRVAAVLSTDVMTLLIV